MNLVDWMHDNYHVESLPDYIKLELVFLLKWKQEDHPILNRIVFTNMCLQNIAHFLKPEQFAATEHNTTDFIGQPEVIYLMKLRGELLQEFVKFDYSNPLYMMHQLFFWTNMRQTEFYDQEAEHYLNNLLGTDPWLENEREKPYNEILHDWWGSILLALKCMNCDLPQNKVDYLLNIDYNNLSKSNYHAYLIKELFESI